MANRPAQPPDRHPDDRPLECLAVIPARGGSKGLPRKNALPLGGRPLVAHSIAAALAATRITRVVVSTDDDEIAAIAARHGADVVRRPAELSGDTASSESAVLHCLDALRAEEGYQPDLVMLIQCTSPLTAPADLDGAIAEMVERGADSCFTAVPFHHFLWSAGDDGRARGINHAGAKRQRRQDLPPQYLENGAAYVARTEAFRAAGDRFCGEVVIHVVPAERCLEIDTPLDMIAAGAVLPHVRPQAALPARVAAVVMDFDGVLTDDRVLVLADGTEGVMCSRADGLGLERLRKRGVELWILSRERNPVVARRAEKLGIPCLQAVDDKPSALAAWASERGVDLAEVVFVGNDVTDVECMARCGLAAAPADAHPRARAAADLVLTARGGHGAVRELCDLLEAHAARPRGQ